MVFVYRPHPIRARPVAPQVQPDTMTWTIKREVAMSVTERTFEAIALEDFDRKWELHRGRLREKPAMTWDHNGGSLDLAVQLYTQLDRRLYRVNHDSGRLRRQDVTYYIPDVFVVPASYGVDLRGRQDRLQIHDGPALLVVEVWSPSTGDYDIDAKLPEYRARGDLEIWRLHPYDRVLTVWRRQDDGSYETFQQTGGTIQPIALPGVTIDLDALFD